MTTRRVTSYLEMALVVICFVAVAPIAFDFAWQRYAGTNYWFFYESVEPTKSEFQAGEPIVMRSTREVKRPVTLQFSDKLVCELKGRPIIYSIHSSTAPFDPHSMLTRDWKFEGRTPNFSTVCWMVSSVSALLPHSKQTQIVESGTFHIVAPPAPGGGK